MLGGRTRTSIGVLTVDVDVINLRVFSDSREVLEGREDFTSTRKG